jgi:hypothetical protein
MAASKFGHEASGDQSSNKMHVYLFVLFVFLVCLFVCCIGIANHVTGTICGIVVNEVQGFVAENITEQEIEKFLKNDILFQRDTNCSLGLIIWISQQR